MIEHWIRRLLLWWWRRKMAKTEMFIDRSYARVRADDV